MKDETIQEFKNQEKESAPKRTNALGGIFMIFMGGMALLALSGVEVFGRSPWILFALLPLFWIVAAAYNKYVENGRKIDKQMVFTLSFGLIPVAYILFPMLELSVNVLWPMTMIFIGLGIILFRDR
ncbi:MAG: hypothetical protein IAF02_15950 [Anaerolineae bacterium]|nr:hypothetical protein [Anaerolineae bacterium]